MPAPAPHPRILVDAFERPSGVVEALRVLGVDVRLGSIAVGDYVVGRSTLVERKTVRGLHADVLDGSFWSQIGKLRGACKSPWLLVEGKDLDDGPMSSASVRGVCVAVADQGIDVIRSTGPEDFALWLCGLARRRSSTPPRDRPRYAQLPTAGSRRATAEGVLAAIPGISAGSARALLAAFGSVSGVLAAGPAEWKQVPGIGPKRAQALAEALSYPWRRR